MRALLVLLLMAALCGCSRKQQDAAAGPVPSPALPPEARGVAPVAPGAPTLPPPQPGQHRLATARGEEAPGLPRRAPGQASGSPVPPVTATAGWYDLAPLRVSLRESLRRADLIGGDPRQLPLFELDMDVTGDTYALRETLWYTNRTGAPLSELVLRLYANAVGTARQKDGPRVTVLGGRCLDGLACHVAQTTPSVIVVTPTTPLQPGGRLRVQMEMGGALELIDSARLNLMAQGMEGMANMGVHGGGGDYGLLAQGDGILSFANFFAVLARRHQGAWLRGDASTLGDLGSDELGHVHARVVLEPGRRAYASGVQMGNARSLASGKQLFEYAAAFVRDFSLLVSDRLQSAHSRAGDIQVRSHFLAADAERGRRVLDVATHALALFDRHFGTYPYADFDVVEAPLVGGAGGVEFAGMVTVAAMLYRDFDPGPMGAVTGSGAGAPQQELFDAMLEFVTAHEVAHQYWHGLVGSDSRMEPFVDEGLAQFSAVFYMEQRYGKVRAAKEAERQVAMNYRLMRVMGDPDASVSRPVAAFATPVQYAGLVYGKGPFMYRELRKLAGDGVFFSALRNYVKRYGFRMAPRDGFLRELSALAGAGGVERIATRWLRQTHGDEDLGGADMGALMRSLGGGEGPNPAVHSLMQQLLGSDRLPRDQGAGSNLQELMRQLGGGGPGGTR